MRFYPFISIRTLYKSIKKLKKYNLARLKLISEINTKLEKETLE